MTKRWIALLTLCAMLSGCAVWTRLESGALTHAGITIQTSANWIHLAAKKDGILITRDGALVQNITAEYLEGEKIFPKTKQVFSKDVTPQDLAQRVVAELRQTPAFSGLEIKQIEPAVLAGRPGFRATTEWRNDRGAAYQRVIVGAEQGGGLLLVQYQALKRFFFARDLGEFDRVVASVKRS